jgi:hypothetical protein
MRALHKKGGSPLLRELPPSNVIALAVEAALLTALAGLLLPALLLTGLILPALLLLAGLVLPALLRIVLLLLIAIVLLVRHRDVLRSLEGLEL